MPPGETLMSCPFCMVGIADKLQDQAKYEDGETHGEHHRRCD